MTIDFVLYISKETMKTTVYILAPILGAGLSVGLLIGIFQAVTSIQEMTLTFIPKITVLGLILIFLTPWFLDVLMSFTLEIFNQIATVGMQP
ncbi:MAG TPA: flagellar biosynthetic protein FliQ [Candidatus Marinimicrobia bacterium]|nr:MAG: flagellar biosynthetic protein FliQ [Candidatus Marinimicrobia bacterium CG1_02_48_14]PIZ67270.1 MAG: flagellar biosynthetic protein FliQ [Candidatus Marinimicrobia bacterium CG_4_10_14_0_2_um_filter_48_9]PJA54417.1 MAG: flagellar biosynthetic protein FliQ [Candidatus Marinimicrobia bacterium CG_4_9_14_3_um_filter_48_9]HCW76582.1 flagellar biosynthetic protein FliQ [Candidatus Neomarinimicrobiota bacterium]